MPFLVNTTCVDARAELMRRARARVTEEERDRLEGDKLELAGARHQLEADYKEQLAPLEPSLLASTSVS